MLLWWKLCWQNLLPILFESFYTTITRAQHWTEVSFCLQAILEPRVPLLRVQHCAQWKISTKILTPKLSNFRQNWTFQVEFHFIIFHCARVNEALSWFLRASPYSNASGWSSYIRRRCPFVRSVHVFPWGETSNSTPSGVMQDFMPLLLVCKHRHTRNLAHICCVHLAGVVAVAGPKLLAAWLLCLD